MWTQVRSIQRHPGADLEIREREGTSEGRFRSNAPVVFPIEAEGFVRPKLFTVLSFSKICKLNTLK